MVATRRTPTVGPDSGQDYANRVNVEVAALWNGVFNLLTSIGGTGDHVTANCAGAPLDAYTAGQGYLYTPTATNTLPDPDVNVDGRGAKIIKDQDGVTIPAGKMVVGRQHWLVYDGTFLRIFGPGGPVRFMFYVEGKPSASEKVMALIMTDSVSFPAGMTLSLAKAGVAANASAVFSVQKNGVQFATVTFPATATGAVASSPASPALAVAFAVGDLLSVIAPASTDTTLSDISISLAATH